MKWIDFTWLTATGFCLAMMLIHLGSGLRGASRRANLLFALVALPMAVYSWNELRLIHSSSVDEYLARLRL